VGVAGMQLTVLFFIRERLKRLEDNQEAMTTFIKKGIDHLDQNQKEIHTEVRGLIHD